MLPPTCFYYFVVESRTCNIFFCSLPLNLKQKRQRRRKDKKQKRVSFYPILSRLQTNWSQNNKVAAQHGIVWHKLYMNTDETNTRYIQILQNDEKCEKTITVVLGTNCQKPTYSRKFWCLSHIWFCWKLSSSPKSYWKFNFWFIPSRSVKSSGFWESPPPPPNVQLPTLEWEWIFAVPIYTLILDVSTTVCDTQ